MTQYYKMLDHFKKFGPPIHMAYAAVHGMMKKTSERGSMDDLARLFAGSGGHIRG